MKPGILLIGAGGHCKVIIDSLLVIRKYRIAGIIDLKKHKEKKFFGIPVVGIDSQLSLLRQKGIKFCFICVGSIGDPTARIRLYNLAKEAGFLFPNLISPYALVSDYAVLGEGNYIAPRVVINAGAEIGNNCIINTGVIVEHDCKIGDFVHIAPGSVLNGNVSVGNYSHIGAGSTLLQGIKIGKKTIIGAASLVLKNIDNKKVAYGNPCEERKTNA